MTDNLQGFHHQVSVSAHNQAMDILYADEPSTEQIQSLIGLTHVAHWHWLHRDDRQPQNVSVALWAISRAYSANGVGDLALKYAQESLAIIDGAGLLPSFYGYCNEALARAHALTGNIEQANVHLELAREIAATVPNEQAREYLLDQINRIQL